MNGSKGVFRISSLIGMPVLSLATGNKLGSIRKVLVRPDTGGLLGLGLDTGALALENVHNIGRDAVMAGSELAVAPPEVSELALGRDANGLIGASIVTDSGEVLGRVTDILVAAQQPPFVIFALRRSLLDWLLGRRFYMAEAAVVALSDDMRRLVVPLELAEQISPGVDAVNSGRVAVRTYSPAPTADALTNAGVDEDETVVRRAGDDDETVLRMRDEDETIVRPPRSRS